MLPPSINVDNIPEIQVIKRLHTRRFVICAIIIVCIVKIIIYNFNKQHPEKKAYYVIKRSYDSTPKKTFTYKIFWVDNEAWNYRILSGMSLSHSFFILFFFWQL